ncbi:MAG: family 10 glycosylhydrolase, partial [Methanomicrobiales archaeon]|nr:family 10 glycosylhydrolase [Methanomicrobiales archaeon]
MIIDPNQFLPPGKAVNGLAHRLAAQLGLQGRAMWLDAQANLQLLSSRAGVAEVIGKLKAANINTVIVDVKPLSGLVLYASELAPRLSSVDHSYPADHDLLATVVEEGHKAGLDVHAAINVFSEGSRLIEGGPAHSHPDWQCVEYEMERILSVDGCEPLRCGAGSTPADRLLLYGRGEQFPEDFVEDSFCAVIDSDGRVVRAGLLQRRPSPDTARDRFDSEPFDSTCAAGLIPPGGFAALGTGILAQQLRCIVESGSKTRLQSKSALARVGTSGDAHHAVFVNPLHPKVREYELSIVGEICRSYPVDGLVFDRMRYPNIYSDFSSLTRKALESAVGRSFNWPDDVFRRDPTPGEQIIRGPLFGEWLKLRAHAIRDFIAEARALIKSVRPNAALGVYTGSWYPVYYDVGVNWGSPDHVGQFEWWPEGYESAGFADLVDYLCTGCYYEHPTRAEATTEGFDGWRSVEAAAEESTTAVDDAAFVYGGLYLKQYEGRPDRFADAVRVCLEKTQGCMLFDLVYV